MSREFEIEVKPEDVRMETWESDDGVAYAVFVTEVDGEQYVSRAEINLGDVDMVRAGLETKMKSRPESWGDRVYSIGVRQLGMEFIVDDVTIGIWERVDIGNTSAFRDAVEGLNMNNI